jgi:hypothetical protein
MAGRSIEEILRQQAAQRQAQIQAQQARERAVWEQRERARQEYLNRNKMYEKVGVFNPSAASSAAGGSIKNSIPTINGHAEFILFKTSDLNNWQYVILDYLAETISDIKDTGVAKTESRSIKLVENTGFIVEFNTKILFINDNAEIIETLDKTNFKDSINRRNYYYVLLNDGTLYQFDGKVVTTFSGMPIGSQDTSLRLTKNSLIITTIESNTNQDASVYIWNPTIGLSSALWSGVNREGVGLTNRLNGVESNDNTTFFSVAEYNDAADGWKTIHMFGDDGTVLTALDVTSLASNLSYAFQTPTFLSDNKLEFSVHRSASPASSNYFFNIYDYNTDTWRKSTHSKTNYGEFDGAIYQNQYDGSQYTSLSNGSFHLLYNTNGSTASAYNIDLYRYIDVVWSINGSTFSSYVVNNSGVNNKGIDVNDANRDGLNNNSLYIGKSIFLPMWLNDSTFRLLCLTSTQSLNIAVGSTTGLNGSQGSELIPGWNAGQRYASFRVGDNFGVWLAYASNDVYKIYNEVGTNVISLTMSTSTRLNYTGDLAVVTNETTGIEYVFTSSGLSASTYATYSTLNNITHYGLKPTYTDGDTTPSLMLNLNEGYGGPSRIFTDEDVYEFTLPETTYNRWLSDEYIVSEGRDGANYNLYFHDWTGTLLATIDTGIASGTSYEADLVKDRIYFKVVEGSTTTFYYFSPTKSDSVPIQNITTDIVNYDYWPWFID